MQRHVGFLSLDLPPDANGHLLEAEGFGLLQTPEAFIAGYHSVSLLTISDSCHVILWIESEEQLKLLDELLRDHKDICAVKKTER